MGKDYDLAAKKSQALAAVSSVNITFKAALYRGTGIHQPRARLSKPYGPMARCPGQVKTSGRNISKKENLLPIQTSFQVSRTVKKQKSFLVLSDKVGASVRYGGPAGPRQPTLACTYNHSIRSTLFFVSLTLSNLICKDFIRF